MLIRFGIDIPVLNPSGPIGQQERDLIILAVGLSAIVVIPVYFMLFFFARRYRIGNKKAKYNPEFDHSRLIESVWWGIPLIIITILAFATWRGSHDLDPSKPLSSDVQPLSVQVVALQWKWLFIYPQENIATVNYLQFPQKTPINFDITADAPMNSFWIPKLGGQIYAMSGMSTKLHLQADSVGSYYGTSANISGRGFSDMKFIAQSSTIADYDRWVSKIRQSGDKLTVAEYEKLAKPGTLGAPIYYSSADKDLYRHVIAKFTDPLHAKNIPASSNLSQGGH